MGALLHARDDGASNGPAPWRAAAYVCIPSREISADHRGNVILPQNPHGFYWQGHHQQRHSRCGEPAYCRKQKRLAGQKQRGHNCQKLVILVSPICGHGYRFPAPGFSLQKIIAEHMASGKSCSCRTFFFLPESLGETESQILIC
jgi:hypothetical protein